jgi:hypothetical protein
MSRSIFKYTDDLSICAASLKKRGYYIFQLSDRAKRIRDDAFAINLEALEVDKVKTHHKTAIRMKTDDFVRDNDPKLHELCHLYSDAFHEILSLNIFKAAKNQPFIDGQERYAMVDLVRYNNTEVGGAVINKSLNVVEHYDTGLVTLTLGATSRGLEIKNNGDWFEPEPDEGIVWIGQDGSELGLLPCLHRVKWTQGVVRTTTFGLIGRDVPMSGKTKAFIMHEIDSGSYCVAPTSVLKLNGSIVSFGADYIGEEIVQVDPVSELADTDSDRDTLSD